MTTTGIQILPIIQNKLHIVPSFLDPAFLFKIVQGTLTGLVGSYADDTKSAGDKEFQESSKVKEKIEV